MIKSIRHQTKKISTNWFQIGKYIIVFVIGILLCRGLTKRNYEYLTNTKYVASTNKNLKVVSENNFEPGKWPFKNNNNQGILPKNSNNKNNNNQGILPKNNNNQGILPKNSNNQGILPKNNNNQGILPKNSNNQGILPKNSNNQGILPKNSNNQGILPKNSNKNNNNQGILPKNNNKNNNNQKEITVFPRNSGKVVSSNNFKPGRSPTNNPRNNNKGTLPVKMPSPNNSSGVVKMPSPNNSSGETGLATKCREANWIPRNECNTNTNTNKNKPSRSFRGFGLAQQIGGPGTPVEGFTSGHEYFNINKVTGSGYRDSPSDTSITTSFAGTNYDVNMDSFGNSNILEGATNPETPEEEEWQCNQFIQDGGSEPTCIKVDRGTGTPINPDDVRFTGEKSNINPFIELCEKNGCVNASGTPLSDDDIKGLLTKLYDGDSNNPWFTRPWISWTIPIKEDIRAPGYEKETECNEMIYDDTKGVLKDLMRCHNNKYEVSIPWYGVGIIFGIGFIVSIIGGYIMSSPGKKAIGPGGLSVAESSSTGSSIGGFVVIVIGIIIMAYGGMITFAKLHTGPEGTGKPEGPNRTPCSSSLCIETDGYEPNGEDFGETINQCCNPIVDTCRYWWDNDSGGCSEGQVNYEGHAGIKPGVDEQQDICCAMSCEDNSECDDQVTEECINKICVCKDGYGVSATGSCEETCDTWNNDSSNVCPPGKNFINGDGVPGNYLEECCGDFECGNITDGEECIGDCIWDETPESGVCKDKVTIPS